MKIKEGFMLRKVGDVNVVVPIGEASTQFHGMITLNSTGVMLWEKLSNGATREELVAAFLEKYDVDEATAKADIDAFIAKAKGAKLLEE